VIKQIGKIGKRNIAANKIIKKLFMDKGIYYCELKLTCCTGGGDTFAHRHKRHYYRGQMDKLSDFTQVALSCIACHQMIEKSKCLTEAAFMRLRGKED